MTCNIGSIQDLERRAADTGNFALAMLAERIRETLGKHCVACGRPSTNVTAATFEPDQYESLGFEPQEGMVAVLVFPLCPTCRDLAEGFPELKASIMGRVRQFVEAGQTENFGLVRKQEGNHEPHSHQR